MFFFPYTNFRPRGQSSIKCRNGKCFKLAVSKFSHDLPIVSLVGSLSFIRLLFEWQFACTWKENLLSRSFISLCNKWGITWKSTVLSVLQWKSASLLVEEKELLSEGSFSQMTEVAFLWDLTRWGFMQILEPPLKHCPCTGGAAPAHPWLHSLFLKQL